MLISAARLPTMVQPSIGLGVPIAEPSFAARHYFVWRSNKTHMNPTGGGSRRYSIQVPPW